MLPLSHSLVDKYQATVKNSLLEVEELLGSFDFALAPPQPVKTTPTRQPPISTMSTSSRVAEAESQGFIQEVEVPLYDSDSLPSPPSSKTSSEADPMDGDRLLDFSRDDDEFSYNPGYVKKKVGRDFTQEGMEAPRIMKAMLQARHGIEVCVGMCMCMGMCMCGMCMCGHVQCVYVWACACVYVWACAMCVRVGMCTCGHVYLWACACVCMWGVCCMYL